MRVTLAMAISVLASGATAAGFEDQFKRIDRTRWHVANYDFSHPAFDTDWRAGQLNFDDSLTLNLSPHEGLNSFAGGSIRTKETHHYGRYEARLQAARGDGVITGFFTYTGPHYGTRHDEIDIEILGKDTTKLHIAWFVDGRLTNRFIPLGFDAADQAHDYAFEWAPDRLAWFVDGDLVFEHLRSQGPVPSVPSYLFANIWAADPSIAIWSGVVAPNWQTKAVVHHVRFAPFDANPPPS